MSLFLKISQLKLLLVACLLAGCQSTATEAEKSHDEIAPVDAITGAEAQTEVDEDTLRLQQCNTTLEALHSVNARQFSTYHQAFEHLMKGAARYASLRTRINNETQDTIDSLYRYRVNKLCAQIDQAILLGLVEQGESVK